MSVTTFLLVAVEHDPDTYPELWDWTAFIDHTKPIALIAHGRAATAAFPAEMVDQVRHCWGVEWQTLALTAPICIRCEATPDDPTRDCSLCFRRMRASLG